MNDTQLNLPTIREIIKEYGLDAQKKLGQNFLFDLNITDKIVRIAGDLQDKLVVEIGPGPGSLTRAILKSGCKKLIAVEKDSRCTNALNNYLLPHYKDRLSIIDGDALDMSIYDALDDKIIVIANLPYNIATELLMSMLGNVEKYSGFILMMQKEVVCRLAALPRTKDYGRISIKSQWLCQITREFDISPQAFFPHPKVTSSIVKLIPRQNPILCDEKKLDKVLLACFTQRRKIIKSSLKKIVANPKIILDKLNINHNARPEELDVAQFCALANFL